MFVMAPTWLQWHYGHGEELFHKRMNDKWCLFEVFCITLTPAYVQWLQLAIVLAFSIPMLLTVHSNLPSHRCNAVKELDVLIGVIRNIPHNTTIRIPVP